METKTSRQVKLYGKRRETGRHWPGGGSKEVPWLNLSGVWLERAGFKIGDQVEILIEENQLIIKNAGTPASAV
ncbi:MAG: SymE family type I addiction module toxin [Bacteroidota bacterium]|nr:SymE family type I addiction module toxin [Bacteroidota bacterium]